MKRSLVLVLAVVAALAAGTVQPRSAFAANSTKIIVTDTVTGATLCTSFTGKACVPFSIPINHNVRFRVSEIIDQQVKELHLKVAPNNWYFPSVSWSYACPGCGVGEPPCTFTNNTTGLYADCVAVGNSLTYLIINGTVPSETTNCETYTGVGKSRLSPGALTQADFPYILPPC